MPLRILRRLRRVTHWELGLGPTFQREMRTLGRKRGTYISRSGVVLVMLGLLALIYLGFASELEEQRQGVARLQTLSTLAPAVTIAVLWFQLIVLGFLAPSLTSGSVCDEKRNRTLAALLTTPLTAAEIISGKLTSAIVQLGILILTALPILLAVRVFGGVPTSIVLMGLSVVVATCILGMSASLCFSVMAKKPSSAAGSAMAVVTIVNFFPVVFLLLNATTGLNFQFFMKWLLPMCAPYVMGEFSGVIANIGGLGGMGSASRMQHAWILNLAYTLGLSAFFVFYATVRFRAVMRSESVERVEQPRSRRARKAKRRSLKDLRAERDAASATISTAAPSAPEPDDHVSDQERYADDSRTVGDNPVLWREMNQQAFRTPLRLIITLIAVVAVGGWLYSTASMDERPIHVMIGVIGMLALLAQACGHTTGSITAEREGRTWDVLLTTTLTPRQILLAKALGPMRHLWFIPGIVFAHFIIWGLLAGHHRPIVFIHLGLIAASVTFFLCCSGVYHSLTARKSTIASTSNYMGAGLLWVGLPMILAILGSTMRMQNHDTWRAMQEALLWINPVFMTGTIVDNAFIDHDSWRTPGMYTVFREEISTATFTFWLTVVSGFYVALGLGFLALARARFARKGGRTS